MKIMISLIRLNKCRAKRKYVVKRIQEKLNIIIFAGKVKSKRDMSELKAHDFSKISSC